MGLVQFVKSVCVQSAIYWAPIGYDGYGSATYADPVEIKCRWDNVETVKDNTKMVQNEWIAEILITAPVEVEGYLMLGELPDYPDIMSANPLEYQKAYPIMSMSTTPLVKSKTQFIYVAYVGNR